MSYFVFFQYQWLVSGASTGIGLIIFISTRPFLIFTLDGNKCFRQIYAKYSEMTNTYPKAFKY